jgi:branched-chain amino acid transport system substrate-binding protein
MIKMKNKNNLLWIGLALIILIGVGYWWYGKNSATTSSPVQIGMNLPLTGKIAFYGNEIKDAITLLKEQGKLNSAEFLFEDNQSTPQNSVTVMNKLASNSNIPIIVSSNSPLTVPLAPIAAKNKKILIGMVNGAKDFGLSNEWTFRDAITPEQTGKGLASYTITEKKLKLGVTLSINDDYGLGVSNWFKNDIEKLGGTILEQETFTKDDTDFRGTLLKLMDKKPDFILVVGREKSLIGIINQIRERDKNILILTTDAFESESVQNGIQISKNLVFSSYANNSNSEVYKHFEDSFLKKFKRKPSVYAFDGYTTSIYINELVGKFGKDSQKIKNALNVLETNSGIKGVIKCNSNREILSPVGIFTLDEQRKKELLFKIN